MAPADRAAGRRVVLGEAGIGVFCVSRILGKVPRPGPNRKRVGTIRL